MSPSRNRQRADPKNISDSKTANPKNILDSKTADSKNLLEKNQDKWKSVTEEDGRTQPFIYTDDQSKLGACLLQTVMLIPY